MAENVHIQGDPRDVEEIRRDLSRRLDDLRGLGLLPAWSEGLDLSGEGELLRLSLSLVDLLESAQRRVIESSIQILSLRELVAHLLGMRTPDQVARTVALYLNKAFDHERVLVAVHDPESDALRGWTAVRAGSPRSAAFTLEGSWSGALRDVLDRGEPLRSWQDDTLTPLLEGPVLPEALVPFTEDLGPFVVFPLGGAQERSHGVLAVARTAGSPGLENGDADMLASFVDAVATALENLLLDEEMRRQEAFRKDIMESMTTGLVAVDPAGRILGANPRGEELAGRPVGSLCGASLDVLDPDGRGMADLVRRTLATGRPATREELRLSRPDAPPLPVLCRTSLLRNHEGETYGAIVVFEDLTPIKAMEERIRQLDRLAALGRFTAGVAHEIRNPLGGIAAGVQYLERHLSLDEGQTENVAFLHKEIRRLDRIVEDLFRVTHPSPPRRTPEDPRQLAEHAVRSLGSGPAESGVEVTVDMAGDLPPVAVDPDQIQQVLLNLIKNAVEAVGPGGSVRLTAEEETAGLEPMVALRVRDSGPGIPPDALPHVFEPFFTQGKAEGTGLGLYVSHGIVERHGGELLAANGSDGGAEFTLRLPLTRYDSTEMVA